MRGREKETKRSLEEEKDTKTSQEHDLIEEDERTYSKQELEEQISQAVNEALSSEFLNMLKHDHEFKDEILSDSLLSITSFKTLGFVKGLLLSTFLYSGIIALYSLLIGGVSVEPKASILLFGMILTAIDKTVRPIVIMIERSVRFRTSGILLILAYSGIMYYISILLTHSRTIKIIFSSFHVVVLLSILMLLAISIIDDLVKQYQSNLIQKIGSENNE